MDTDNDSRVPLVNPTTDETMMADPGQLAYLKMPDAYVLADDLSTSDWFTILARVTRRSNDD